jgi:hypothetical protein
MDLEVAYFLEMQKGQDFASVYNLVESHPKNDSNNHKENRESHAG